MTSQTGSAYNRVCQRLLEVTGYAPRGTAARCPAHDDRSPSLSITRKPDRVLLNCQAGCTIDAILAALGLTTADLFDEPTKRDRPTVAAEYQYVDEDGQLLYVKERRIPKDFRVKKPTKGGGWTWQLGDTKRVLYHLPEVIKAVKNGQPIYVVEGEKDADKLTALGLIATCNFEGAAKEKQRPKWRPEYTQTLKGAREVVIIADRDDAGYAHARAVAKALTGNVEQVRIVHAAVEDDHADVSDHLAAGHTLAQLQPVPGDQAEPVEDRRLRLTLARDIQPRPVRWLWTGRIAMGTLALLAGREGIGKSTIAYDLAAAITRGVLPGWYQDQPRSVLIAATEDSWEHTIIPRLMAARANRDLIYKLDVVTIEDNVTGLKLPLDNRALEKAINDTKAGLLLFDPLMSRLDAKLDTHKDAEVRQALEPLTALADRASVSVLGLIHVNKTSSTDPLTVVMASRAFVSVARSVLFAAKDPDEPRTRYLGTPKNNLGDTDQPTLTYEIQSQHVADTDEGPVFTGRVNWLGETDRDISEVIADSGEPSEVRTRVAEAAEWLKDYLTKVGGISEAAKIKEEGKRAGINGASLDRARLRLRLVVESSNTFPRQTFWRLRQAPTDETTGANGQPANIDTENAVVAQSSHLSTTATTATTATTGESTTDNNNTDFRSLPPRATDPNVQSSQSSQSYRPPAHVRVHAREDHDDPWTTWPTDTQGEALNPNGSQP